MNTDETISDDQLNALMDNELDAAQRAALLAAMNNNDALLARYAALRQVKDLMLLAYADPPKPAAHYAKHRHRRIKNSALAVAASVVLAAFSGLLGVWFGYLHAPMENITPPSQFQTTDALRSKPLQSDRIILHISSMDQAAIESVFDTTENILRSAQQTQNAPPQVEVVANAQGLGVLRRHSPYTQRIRQLSAQFPNVKFLACGIAKQSARLTEQRDIELLPEAEDIPAALDRILERLQQGWTYVRDQS